MPSSAKQKRNTPVDFTEGRDVEDPDARGVVVEAEVGADEVGQRLVGRTKVGDVGLVLLVGRLVGAVHDNLERVARICRGRVGTGDRHAVDWSGPGEPGDCVVLASDGLSIDGCIEARRLNMKQINSLSEVIDKWNQSVETSYL